VKLYMHAGMHAPECVERGPVVSLRSGRWWVLSCSCCGAVVLREAS
jgi:hypothetical protein